MSNQNKHSQRKIIWEEHIKNWEQSGLTLITYFAKHKINQSTLYYWRNKLKIKQPPISTAFIPIRTHPANTIVHFEYIIVKFLSMVIQIPIAMDTDDVVKLICALGKTHDYSGLNKYMRRQI